MVVDGDESGDGESEAERAKGWWGHAGLVPSVTDANRRAWRVSEKLGFEVASDPPEKLRREMALGVT